MKNVPLYSTTSELFSEVSRFQYDCRCFVGNWKKGVDVEISLVSGLVFGFVVTVILMDMLR